MGRDYFIFNGTEAIQDKHLDAVIYIWLDEYRTIFWKAIFFTHTATDKIDDLNDNEWLKIKD